MKKVISILAVAGLCLSSVALAGGPKKNTKPGAHVSKGTKVHKMGKMGKMPKMTKMTKKAK